MATAAPSRLGDNTGRPDRMIRIVAGLAILTLGLLFQSWWGLVGFAPLMTGVSGFCPLYQLLGVNTCPAR